MCGKQGCGYEAHAPHCVERLNEGEGDTLFAIVTLKAQPPVGSRVHRRNTEENRDVPESEAEVALNEKHHQGEYIEQQTRLKLRGCICRERSVMILAKNWQAGQRKAD